jgi:hypothetical protein
MRVVLLWGSFKIYLAHLTNYTLSDLFLFLSLLEFWGGACPLRRAVFKRELLQDVLAEFFILKSY